MSKIRVISYPVVQILDSTHDGVSSQTSRASGTVFARLRGTVLQWCLTVDAREESSITNTLESSNNVRAGAAIHAWVGIAVLDHGIAELSSEALVANT